MDYLINGSEQHKYMVYAVLKTQIPSRVLIYFSRVG